MSVKTSDNLEDLCFVPSPEIWEILLEYHRLASSHRLSQEEETRLGRILDRACANEVMTFWIGEIDYLIGKNLGLFTPQNCHSYYNQQAQLKEYLTNPESTRDRASNDRQRQPTGTKK